MNDQAKWLELARRTTTSERAYAELAEQCWRSFDVTKAIQYRGRAEGLAMAGDHQLEISREARETTEPAPLDAAMHSIWMHGVWRDLTVQMTTEEREAAARAVERYAVWLGRQDSELGGEPAGLRWWL